MDWFKATYHLESTPADIEARAEALAIEQSLEMPPSAVRQPEILRDILARVESIEPAEPGYFRVTLEMSVATTGLQAAGLLNVLFGNCALQEDVELVDVEFPPSLLEVFPGPQYGILGLRNLLGVHDRPLTCTALKPQGLGPQGLADLAYTFASGGLDVVKDDHGITNQAYAPFHRRVPAIQRAVERANRETGGRTLYAPMLAGSPRVLEENLRVARGEGIQAVLVAPMLIGLPLFEELVRNLGLAVLAHPAFAGNRIRPPLFFGKLFRLFGADAVIYPNHGGRFSYSSETCMSLAQAARAPWAHLRPALPVPAGGMTVERVEEILGFYGLDTMLLIGGNLLAAGEGVLERTRAFVGRVAASSVGFAR